MSKYIYQVIVENDVIAKFVFAADAQIFADALYKALEQRKTIRVETSKEAILKYEQVA